MDARQILERMTALCSRSECCPGDVRAKIEKLASSCEEPVDVDGMMKTLQDEGYLNENRYSEAFACKKYGGFYLGSIGGPAALLAKENIKSVECVEYPELGMEAIWKIRVEDFPAFILVDDKGDDFFQKFK